MPWEVGLSLSSGRSGVLSVARSHALQPGPARALGVGWFGPWPLAGRAHLEPSGNKQEAGGFLAFPVSARFWLGKRILSTFGVEGCVGVVPVNYQTPSPWP